MLIDFRKKDIDLLLKHQKIDIVKSRIEKKINVQFESAHVAWEVRNFLMTKELTYQGLCAADSLLILAVPNLRASDLTTRQTVQIQG